MYWRLPQEKVAIGAKQDKPKVNMLSLQIFMSDEKVMKCLIDPHIEVPEHLRRKQKKPLIN